MTQTHPVLSIVTPAFNESANLPLLYERLSEALDPLNIGWEWIVVDDHSRDETFAVASALSLRDPRVRAYRFSRNFGSHIALTCGLEHARGACAVVMAADLQDPPETLPALLEKWKSGAQVVWAVRRSREGEKASTVGSAKLFYFIMRHLVGMKNLPPSGADFFLLDRRVIDALTQFRENNVSLMALITWMGFAQAHIEYDKQARVHGESGWSLKKKLKLAVDSVTSFTYLPIRLMSYVGAVVALVGFLYALVVVVNALAHHPVEGWSSLMIAVLLLGGIQMLMLGVLGEYLWRALDEARRRPRYLIEQLTPNAELEAASPAAMARGNG